MPTFTPKNDIEAIDFILNEMFKEKVPYCFNDEIIRGYFDSSYLHEADRIIRKMTGLGLIIYKKDPIHKILEELFYISDFGIEILNEHGTYSNYISSSLASDKRKNKAKAFDRVIKNGNLIAAILISGLSLFVTQLPISSNKQLHQIKQDIQLVSNKLDSLKQLLHNIPIIIKTKEVKDTAIKK